MLDKIGGIHRTHIGQERPLHSGSPASGMGLKACHFAHCLSRTCRFRITNPLSETGTFVLVNYLPVFGDWQAKVHSSRGVYEEMTQRVGYQSEYRSGYATAGTPLTRREWEILWMISRGHDNKGIGELLGIRTQTVKNHTSNVLSKMRARNRTEAVMMAIRKGWLELPIDSANLNASGGGADAAPSVERTRPGPGEYAMGGHERRFSVTG